MRDSETPEIAEKLARPLGTWKIRLKNFLVKTVFERFRRSAQEVEEQQEEVQGNPFLPKLRSILEQLLPMYQISYKEFRPLMIDTDSPPESLLDEDSVAVVLEQISEDLNFLRIATDRPAYFSDYIQRMYEETGLVVQTEPKEQEISRDVNVILDMEQQGDIARRYMRAETLYIPVFKRQWRRLEPLQNLDISIPIGYNTVIVKGIS